MSMKNIEFEITIDNEGNISYKVKGAKGKSCTDESKFLDDALGEVTERKFTREYYEQPVRIDTRINTKR